MRFRTLFFTALLAAFCTTGLLGQVTLYSENFDACFLPPGWTVNLTGNQDPVWYVGDAILNNDHNGESMNGSCFVFIDDDATGDQTLPYVIDFVSPPFDASQYQTIELSVDVHYRDWGSADEYFAILLTDGVTETEIIRFDKTNATGDSIGEYVTVKADLSVLTQSPNARLIFRYDDAGGFNWWAGFDNIAIKGYGDGTNVVAESFNQCTQPAGWESEILTGDANWSFGKNINPKAQNGNSMNGSCFAYFDDDLLSDSAAYSTARLYTPWFDGTQFGQFTLDFDLILRYYSEIITIYVQNGAGEEVAVSQWGEDVGGPLFNNFVHQTFDLSPYRAAQMRVAFEYTDGNDWAWWAGIDNVKISGKGAANDLCINAEALLTNDMCKAGDNRNAVLDGPPADCVDKNVAGLWYKWQADFTGTAKLSTKANFNDIVNVYAGSCGSLQAIACDNRDEHGFTGETTYFSAQSGTQYLIRISGVDGGFGVPRGDLCVKLEQIPGIPAAPANDNCVDAVALAVDGACINSNNLNATMSSTQPSLNKLARADVWYKFTAPVLSAGQGLEVQSNAAFSDIITLYQGACINLTEVAGNHRGSVLELPALTSGQTYFVQIAGNFATVEGNLCPQVLKKAENAPANDNCLSALPVSIGGQCVNATNENATFSGNIPPCVPVVDRDIWFTFTASASGAVRINTGAAFEHVLAVWAGACNNLTPVFCIENPLRCDGYVLVGNLNAGQTYYVQIASRSATAGPVSGEVCLKILDGSAPPEFEALNLQVEEDCNGTNTAALLINTSGGVPPFNFQGNQNGQILQSGDVYFVVVTDAIGCERSLLGLIDDCTSTGCTVVASISPLQPSCFDVADGHLSINVAGGTPPYTYKWSNGAETAEISGLNGGDYTVTVTDALGCDQVTAQTLTNPTQVVAVPGSVEQPAAGQSNGAIYVDVSGGTGQYAFAWFLNGAPFVASEDLTNAPAGDYQLQITDGNGCTGTFTYTLTEIVGTGGPVETMFAEVFPNPAKEKAVLAVSLPKPTTLYLALSDGAGRVLQAWTVEHVTEQNIPMDVKDLPGGVYQLRILAGKENLVRKVVVVR